jgi:hypothetical protein
MADRYVHGHLAPEHRCIDCDCDLENEDHYEGCLTLAEENEDARIERLIDMQREGWGIYRRGEG